ncbi:MAG: sigma 54-interacting transcriptional regulator [Zoogloeaceae bacterium]|nr:sigma 54-interacting transcriptional regulator [Zoogloeaceae bacterium]
MNGIALYPPVSPLPDYGEQAGGVTDDEFPVDEPLSFRDKGGLLAFREPHSYALSIRARALVFEDPKSRQIREHIERLAPHDVNVLVCGATGTGKELIARYLHSQSQRARKSFLAINCGAIAENLIEAELFGYERGAFTGAVASKAGWFEAADNGSLFLDEIGDLPLNQQVKLLRVLQEREVVRLGGRKPIPINVRLIAATNVDLEEAVSAGRFREDLYYRLKVATVVLPPLRERPADIPILLSHFVQYYSQRLARSGVFIAPATIASLMAFPWPGNIRELENAVHHALIVGRDKELKYEDFGLMDRLVSHNGSDSDVGNLKDALRRIYASKPQGGASVDELIAKTIIEEAFEYCGRNQSATARLLGITRNVARGRLLAHGLISDELDPPRVFGMGFNGRPQDSTNA